VTGVYSPEIKWVCGSLALPLLPITRLNLPKRTQFWLRFNAITMVGDFKDFSEPELLKIRCFNAKSLAVVKERLELNGAKLRDSTYPQMAAAAHDWREGLATWTTHTLTGLACLLAGPRHAHLAGPWRADLYGDPQDEARPPARRQIRLASGFVVAAVRCRFDDAANFAWRPVDRLLASWRASALAVALPVAVAAAMVLAHEGVYGLIANAENLCATGMASYLAIKGLRYYRQIGTPKRSRKTQRHRARLSPASALDGSRPASHFPAIRRPRWCNFHCTLCVSFST
jgi:hypothetical protein